MLSLRMLRTRATRRLATRLATTASAPSITRTSSSAQSVIPLSSVEVQWERLNSDEQLAIHRHVEELQKKDWKSLTVDEKRAAYYIAFGPHGPRAPIKPPGANVKIFFGVIGCLAVAGTIYGMLRLNAPPPPKTMTKEWQEAMNERAIEKKQNPISGIASEGYKGTGFVQSK